MFKFIPSDINNRNVTNIVAIIIILIILIIIGVSVSLIYLVKDYAIDNALFAIPAREINHFKEKVMKIHILLYILSWIFIIIAISKWFNASKVTATDEMEQPELKDIHTNNYNISLFMALSMITFIASVFTILL